MSTSSEDEARGLNTLGNPERQIRTGEDRGPEGENRIGASRPGGILARGTESAQRKGMGGMRAGTEKLRGNSR